MLRTQSGPAVALVPPRRRQSPVPAAPQRNASDDRLQNAARPIGGDQILRRGGVALEAAPHLTDLADVVDRSCASQIQQRCGRIARYRGRPAEAACRQASLFIGWQNHASIAVADGDRNRVGAAHEDPLLDLLELDPAVAATNATVFDLFEEQVVIVEHGIGEAPGEIRPTADDNERETNQRHPGGLVVGRP